MVVRLVAGSPASARIFDPLRELNTNAARDSEHDYSPQVATGRGPDLDGDGLSDGAEVNLHGTDPLNADTDGDGYEVGAGTDPLDPKSRPGIPVPALTPIGRGMAVLLLLLAGAGWLARQGSV